MHIINTFKLYAASVDYKLVFVDDHSTDIETKEILNNLHFDNVIVLKNAGKGQHSAIMTGFKYAYKTKSAYMGAIDCDMQDPVSVFVRMYKELKCKDKEGIIGVRVKREDTFFKKLTANAYYCLIGILSRKKQHNSSDFYIVKTRLLNKIDEAYIRGSIGRLDVIKYPYERKKRIYGKSKYTLGEMIKVGIKGIAWTIRNR